MLTAVLYTLDATLGDALREVLSGCRQVRADRIVSRGIHNYEAVRLTNSLDPDVILVDFGEWEWAAELGAVLARHAPRSVLVGLLRAGQARPDQEPEVNGWIRTPCTSESVDRACAEAVLGVQKREDRAFFTFLPAKAGSGATTVALHVADALANQMDHRTLLIDGDLRSGVVGLLLNLPQRSSLRDALAAAADLQPLQWNQHISTLEKLDILASRPEQDGPLPTWPDYYKLLQFSAPRYGAVVADLPELVNDATQELLRLSRQVLVVSTAELPALKLAARRVEEVMRRGVGAESVSLVLNRWQSRDMAIDEVEKVVPCAVKAVIPNDYRAVQKAISIGGFVHPETGLGRAYAEFAARLWMGDSKVSAPRARFPGVFSWLVQ